jgi:hypothetical protein
MSLLNAPMFDESEIFSTNFELIDNVQMKETLQQICNVGTDSTPDKEQFQPITTDVICHGMKSVFSH